MAQGLSCASALKSPSAAQSIAQAGDAAGAEAAAAAQHQPSPTRSRLSVSSCLPKPSHRILTGQRADTASRDDMQPAASGLEQHEPTGSSAAGSASPAPSPFAQQQEQASEPPTFQPLKESAAPIPAGRQRSSWLAKGLSGSLSTGNLKDLPGSPSSLADQDLLGTSAPSTTGAAWRSGAAAQGRRGQGFIAS